ncbi:MAG: methylated-DNA--[protein]-cysteine S-methyltransferase, partial [Sphingomonadales bacterium]
SLFGCRDQQRAETSLGPLLIAATEKGLCRVAFDEDSLSLARRFPAAEIVGGGAALAALAARVVSEVECPGRDGDLPVDVQGTAFQEAVWNALRAIPVGETRSYAQIAAAAGSPGAVRAAGSACGTNPVAVVVPCHRVQRADGGIGGYAYGPDRKPLPHHPRRRRAGRGAAAGQLRASAGRDALSQRPRDLRARRRRACRPVRRCGARATCAPNAVGARL